MSVRITALTKRYGTTLALDDVSLDLPPGQVHALLGHNGAGKSTLIRCLGGGTAPTSGTIEIDGRPVGSWSPHESIRSGVSVIYQNLSLIDGLTVTENLFLGQERTRAGVIRRRSQRRSALAALDRVGAHGIDPDALVGSLPIAHRQLVEIAKSLQRDARLLILDEPTAALSVQEADQLGELLIGLKRRGIAILYVTHLLSEVLRLADRATILRNGRVVWSAEREGITRRALVEAISDSATLAHEPPAPPRLEATPALRVSALEAVGIGPIDFALAPGEIVACYGLIGSGRSRMMNVLFGRLPVQGGEVLVDGAPVALGAPARALRAGISLVPADRLKEGLFTTLPASENAVMGVMRSIARLGVRSFLRERQVFDDVARWLNVIPRSPALPASGFSGGNQQKILLGRWVNDRASTRVLLLDDPTQGVDVGARADIYRAIRTLAARKGIGVLVATNEAEEVMDLAHRCLYFRDGQVVGEVAVADTTPDELLTFVHSEGGETSPRVTPTTDGKST